MICPTCRSIVAVVVQSPIRRECTDCATKRQQPYRLVRERLADMAEGIFEVSFTHPKGPRAERQRAANRKRQPRFLARLVPFSLKRREYKRRVLQAIGVRV